MPIQFIRNLADGGSLALWHIQEGEKELSEGLKISAAELEELEGLKSEKGRIRWLAVRRALSSLFPGYVECFKDEHGKPYIKDYPGFISLSHSNEYAVAMTHPRHPVGVDIEIIQPKIRRIVSKFLNEREIEAVKGGHEIEKLYACWCAKESIFKWQGKKGISLKQNIEVSPFHYEEAGFLQARLHTPGYNRHLTVSYEKVDGYFLAYVCNP